MKASFHLLLSRAVETLFLWKHCTRTVFWNCPKPVSCGSWPFNVWFFHMTLGDGPFSSDPWDLLNDAIYLEDSQRCSLYWNEPESCCVFCVLGEDPFVLQTFMMQLGQCFPGMYLLVFRNDLRVILQGPWKSTLMNLTPAPAMAGLCGAVSVGRRCLRHCDWLFSGKPRYLELLFWEP